MGASAGVAHKYIVEQMYIRYNAVTIKRHTHAGQVNALPDLPPSLPPSRPLTMETPSSSTRIGRGREFARLHRTWYAWALSWVSNITIDPYRALKRVSRSRSRSSVSYFGEIHRRGGKKRQSTRVQNRTTGLLGGCNVSFSKNETTTRQRANLMKDNTCVSRAEAKVSPSSHLDHVGRGALSYHTKPREAYAVRNTSRNQKPTPI